MKCPYCEREMQMGYIYNGSQPVQWIPEGKRPSMWNFSTTEEGICLNSKFIFTKGSGYKAEAYYCGRCKIVIAPTKE